MRFRSPCAASSGRHLMMPQLWMQITCAAQMQRYSQSPAQRRRSFADPAATGPDVGSMSASRIELRPATASDLAAIMALERATDRAPHWPRATYESILSKQFAASQRCHIVAETDGALAGFAVGLMHRGDRVAELESVVVASAPAAPVFGQRSLRRRARLVPLQPRDRSCAGGARRQCRCDRPLRRARIHTVGPPAEIYRDPDEDDS